MDAEQNRNDAQKSEVKGRQKSGNETWNLLGSRIAKESVH